MSDRPVQSHTVHGGISDSAALLELSGVLNSSQSLDFILGNVLLTAMGKLLITKGVVLVAETDGGRYRARALKGLADTHFAAMYHIEGDWHGLRRVDDLRSAADAAREDAGSADDTCALLDACATAGLTALAPMILNGTMVGLVGVGPSLHARPFGQPETEFLESLAAIAATAVNNAVTIERLRGANRRLDTKVQEMNTLFELSREMNASFDDQAILRTLGYALMGQLRATRHLVFAWDGATMQPVLVRVPDFAPRVELFGAIIDITDPVLLNEGEGSGENFQAWAVSQGLRVLIPMRSQNETRGLLCLGERFGVSDYGAQDVEYLLALANITITALENARLVREMVEKQQLEHEISLARSIQKGLLPAVLPTPPGYEIAAANESSLQVGGDYYDAIALSDHEFILAIGDVSGKGIPASLLMANVQAALRAIAPLRLPLAEATERLNAIVFTNTDSDKFITFFWGLLDTEAHTFTYVNAGHNPPWLVSADGRTRPLSEGGLILGILDEVPPYDIETVPLEPGDTIVTYTDGVNEALSVDLVEYGNDRLESQLITLRDECPATIIDHIRRDILTHTIGAKQSDDITMLVVKRLPGA